ncbi:MAG: acylphosphatase [Anaerolineales bacterium]|nr:acylphosphatase [Anaerolineales bacterium]
MEQLRAHVLVIGRVQGVSFRYYTVHEAEAAGVGGWVRNLWDGRVEAVFEGDKDSVERMVAWVKRGPPSARVEEVEVEWQDAISEFDNFRVRMTASAQG